MADASAPPADVVQRATGVPVWPVPRRSPRRVRGTPLHRRSVPLTSGMRLRRTACADGENRGTSISRINGRGTSTTSLPPRRAGPIAMHRLVHRDRQRRQILGTTLPRNSLDGRVPLSQPRRLEPEVINVACTASGEALRLARGRCVVRVGTRWRAPATTTAANRATRSAGGHQAFCYDHPLHSCKITGGEGVLTSRFNASTSTRFPRRSAYYSRSGRSSCDRWRGGSTAGALVFVCISVDPYRKSAPDRQLMRAGLSAGRQVRL